MYLNLKYEKMSLYEIENMVMKLEFVDKKLPNIDDVQDMLSAVRFQ